MGGRYATLANIPGKTPPPPLRHGAATEFIRNNNNLEALRDMLGHADLATTSRYLHLNDDDIANAIDNIHNDNDNDDSDLGDDLAA